MTNKSPRRSRPPVVFRESISPERSPEKIEEMGGKLT